MPLQNYKLVLEYDGASFYGFQRQPHHKTVQQCLEEALSKLFNHPLKIASASSRTDAGVHAVSQVVHFFVDTKLSLFQIQNGLNRYLPYSVSVRSVTKVPKSFHARYSAKSKTYEYRIWNDRVRSPLHAASCFHVPYELNVSTMRRGARFFCGKHDFKSFCASRSSSDEGSTVRTIKRFEVKKRGALIRLIVEADGFLYHMVRNLTGVLIELGRGKITFRDLEIILKSRDRRKAFATAQPQGLCLRDVTY